MTTTHLEPESRKKKERPEWLKKIAEIEPCSECGMIAGSCPFYGDRCPTHPSNREKPELHEEIMNKLNEIIGEQETLPADMQKILLDKLSDLYEN